MVAEDPPKIDISFCPYLVDGKVYLCEFSQDRIQDSPGGEELRPFFKGRARVKNS